MNHQASISVISFLPKMSGLKKILGRLTLLMILFLILPLLAFYVFQVGMIVKANYLLKNYTQELKNLSVENEMLEIETTKNLSLGNIEKEIKKLNFVPVSKIKYIPVSYDYLVRENR